MVSSVISRLKKSKQRIIVHDLAGKAFEGIISAWDEYMFSVRTDNGDDIFFPINGYSHLMVPGGYEKAHRPDESED
jgi:hypothetical protein